MNFSRNAIKTREVATAKSPTKNLFLILCFGLGTGLLSGLGADVSTTASQKIVETIAGHRNWPNQESRPDELGGAVAVDKQGEVYVITYRGAMSVVWKIDLNNNPIAIALVDENGKLAVNNSLKIKVLLLGDKVVNQKDSRSVGSAITTSTNNGFGVVDSLVRFGMELSNPRPVSIAVDANATVYISTKNIAVGEGGVIYFTDKIIKKLEKDGTVTPIAGYSEGSNDGTGPEAQFKGPTGLAVDKGGNIYVADSGNATIRKISSNGTVTTVAGTSGLLGWADSQPTRKSQGRDPSATFYTPIGLAVDDNGNIYVADSGVAGIRVISPDGNVSTVAGKRTPEYNKFKTGSGDGLALSATFDSPSGIALGVGGTLFVVDTGRSENKSKLRKISVGTPASEEKSKGSAEVLKESLMQPRDGVVSTVVKELGNISCFCVDHKGNIYAALIGRDWCSVIVKIASDGARNIVGGKAEYLQRGEGIESRFSRPNGIIYDEDGNLFVTDSDKAGITKISPNGIVSKLPVRTGNSDGSAGALVEIEGPGGIARDATGNIYVSSRIQCIIQINRSGIGYLMAGSPGTVGNADGKGGNARMNNPSAVTVDSAGNVYFLEYASHLRKLSVDGTVTTIAGDRENAGILDGDGVAARFQKLAGIAFTSENTIVVTDSSLVREVSVGGKVRTISGKERSGGAYVPDSYDGSPVSLEKARYERPTAIQVGSNGDIYIADGNIIRRIRKK